MVYPLVMVSPIRKISINTIGLLIAALAGWWAFSATDATPPSFIYAIWTTSYLISGKPFSIREVFYRSKICERHVDSSFQQVQGYTVVEFPLVALDVQSPPKLGITTQDFSVGLVVPTQLTPGPAVLNIRIVWTCSLLPAFFPAILNRRIEKLVPIAVYIKENGDG